jgi:hypothetical protein
LRLAIGAAHRACRSITCHCANRRTSPDDLGTSAVVVTAMSAIEGIVLQNYFHDPNEQH